ncbi:large subunit GTPase 1 [Coelomomyces lativittatus]|nr:large subunit GTPase 1 [Coelomomyces lativittatus]
MGKKKSKESNLGKAIIRDRFKGARPKNNDMTLHSVDTEDGPAWTQLKSITQQNDLEEFLHLASLADTQFTAERQTIEIVNSDQPTSAFVLSEEAETQLRHQHEKFKEFIRIPRKPKWDKRISIQEMQASEKYSFLDWRRQLAHLVASENLLLTPFEKNLEIWKQLWRVVERSDCLLQIVDARNPLFFKCDDLETYAHELCASLPVLLLVNKADLLTVEQRRQWAHYFNENNIRFLFFSALEPSGETDASNSSFKL